MTASFREFILCNEMKGHFSPGTVQAAVLAPLLPRKAWFGGKRWNEKYFLKNGAFAGSV